MAAGERNDPFTSFRFHVEIDGLVIGGVSEITGLQLETETEEYREGGVNTHVYKLPKVTRFPNLTLKRGLTYSDDLWKWYRSAVEGQITRKSGSIILLDSTGAEKQRWNFFQAYPVKWIGPDLKSDTSSVAFETIELVHNGFNK